MSILSFSPIFILLLEEVPGGRRSRGRRKKKGDIGRKERRKERNREKEGKQILGVMIET